MWKSARICLSLKIKALSAGQNHKKASSEGRWELNSDSKKQLLKFKAKKPNPFENLLRLTSRDGSKADEEHEKHDGASKSDHKIDQSGKRESEQKSKKSTKVPETSNGSGGSPHYAEPLGASKNGIESEKDTKNETEAKSSEVGNEKSMEVTMEKPVLKRSNSVQLKSDQPPQEGAEIEDLHALKEKKKKAKKAKKLKREREDSEEGQSHHHHHHHHHHKSKKAKKAERSKSKEKTKEGGEERTGLKRKCCCLCDLNGGDSTLGEYESLEFPLLC